MEDGLMAMDTVRRLVSRRPALVTGVWFVLVVAVGLTAPNLTRLAAEGQAKLLGREAESRRAAEVVRQAWPDQAYESLAVVALHRPGGLTEADRRVRRPAGRAVRARRPAAARSSACSGRTSQAEVAERLVSRDGTLQLVAVPLSTSFVEPRDARGGRLAPGAGRRAGSRSPGGTGGPLDGRRGASAATTWPSVQTSLDRAALATVVLLLIVLLVGLSLVLAGAGAAGDDRRQPGRSPGACSPG